VRSFLAVAVREPALSHAGVLLHGLASAIPGRDCRWVRGDGLHITLHFFGELDEARVGEVMAAVAPAAAAATPFPLALGGVGSFPPRGAPRVLWLGVVGGLQPLAALALDCQERICAAGFEVEERPFAAHCTLGRPRPAWPAAARAAWAAAAAREVELPRFTVDRLTLFRSRPRPYGAEYSVVEELPLGPRGD
jgi:RNA 2',3'-cyclic 3'-phosphodiesterase